MWYTIGVIIAFIIMFREYRGEDKKFIEPKDLVSLVITSFFSWITVGMYITIVLLFKHLQAQKCADIDICKPILKFLDTFIGKNKKEKK